MNESSVIIDRPENFRRAGAGADERVFLWRPSWPWFASATRSSAALANKGNRRAKTARHILRTLMRTSGRRSLGSPWPVWAWAWRWNRSLTACSSPIFRTGRVTSAALRHDIAIGRRFFHQLLSAHCRRRTGAEGRGHPADVAGGVADRQPAHLVLPRLLIPSSGC